MDLEFLGVPRFPGVSQGSQVPEVPWFLDPGASGEFSGSPSFLDILRVPGVPRVLEVQFSKFLSLPYFLEFQES